MTREEQNAKLIELGRWVMDQSRENDIDGGDVQDKLLELGLLHCVTVTAPCGENCHCVEYFGEFPAECLRAVKVEE